ncbi:uncharacterized protein (TIGR02001 family) [Natronocella acetinitrilica]|uniref:Uncharacterized protein (TIGR02001 family) n=1 Tax=Natronocella acetinitrilica TaxID=414046 RepID=A0AAE3GAJ9_9GAMM|nr:TorF family putative porin [Natronocella acetinitrilica]MCP1676767.1 uncharacterized protein (TIGR02001 family) [Natronocella acetinitrilica]
MKKTLAVVASASVLVATSAVSANELGYGFSWGGDFGVTSNDIFQGQSETGGRPAIFGGFEIEHESGFYLGNANLSLFGGKEDPSYLEMEVYGGYGFDVTDALSLDLGVSHFFFPAAGGRAEFTELYAGVGYSFGDLDTGFTVLYELDDGEYLEYILGSGYSMPFNTFAFAELAYVDFDDSDATDFTYWLLGVGVSYAGLDFSVSYGDNDLSRREGGDGEQFAFTISTEF